jgi:hypothetical protein
VRPAKRRQLYLHDIKCDDITTHLEAHGLSIKNKEDIKQIEQIVNIVPEYGKFADKTALEVAVYNTDEEAVACLLELGANPNPNPRLDEEPPLYTAIEKDRIGIVRLLLEYGADVDATKKIGNDDISPLFLAAAKGYDKIIDVLLEKNPRLNDAVSSTANMEKNITPLVVAALEGHKDCVKKLKDAGSKPPTLTQNDFQDFLLAAAHTKLLKRTQMLLDEFKYIGDVLEYSGDPPGVNNYLPGEYSVFYNAVSVTKNLHVVEYLDSKGARLDSKPYGKDPETAKIEYYDLDPKFIKEYGYYLEPIETNNESRPQRNRPASPMRNANANANEPLPRNYLPLLPDIIHPTRAQRQIRRVVGAKRPRGRKTRKTRKTRKPRKNTRRG